MTGLSIQLFGCPSISFDGATALRKPGRSAERLLGYLALHGDRPHHREKLATILWQDAAPEQARNALKTTLWRLRKQVEPTSAQRGAVIKVAPGGEIGLNWCAGIHCDVIEFQRAVAGHATPSCTSHQRLRRSVMALHGELLEGFYDDWIIRERERLNAARARALGILMREATQNGDLGAALEYGRGILIRDPLRESIHREMIRLHLRRGERVQALRQYEACVAILRTELGIEPMPETRALKAQIIAGCPARDDLTKSSDIKAAIARVDLAMSELAQTHADLSRRLQTAMRTGGQD